jgi:asparagine synthase (glutamine-hydrolysing)
MCGIFCAFSPDGSLVIQDENVLQAHFNSMVHRGPDSTQTFQDDTIFMGFHRLSINDLSEDGHQPMCLKDDAVYLICNGEIYNFSELVAEHGFVMESKSDCEVILHMYNKLWATNVTTGCPADIMSKLCNALDGEFAFVIYDIKRRLMMAARDPFGVRPLFAGTGQDKVYLSSELKGIDGLVYRADPFLPGHYLIVNTYGVVEGDPLVYAEYHKQPEELDVATSCLTYEDAKDCVRDLFTKAVAKRVRNTDRGVCALLSGGLDSSLVAALAARHYEPGTFETFSIGMKGSPDLAFSQIVADHIKSKHTIIELTPDNFLEAIQETVRICESYDTTTIRASVGNYLVSKYIRKNTENKVVLNGDYSDEVAGGYLYLRNCTDEREFSDDCRRLVREIFMFDSLRSDRTISSQGLEARTPFSDKAFVDYYQSLPASWRMSNSRMEKSLLREAFDDEGVLLPKSILFRRKEAFSDAVSTPEMSWHTIVKAHIETLVTDEDFEGRADEFPINTPQLKETLYYRREFCKYYKSENVISHYWLPRFCGDMVDPSARELPKTI